MNDYYINDYYDTRLATQFKLTKYCIGQDAAHRAHCPIFMFLSMASADSERYTGNSTGVGDAFYIL